MTLCAVQWAENRGVTCDLRLGEDHAGVGHTNFRVVWSDDDAVTGTGNTEEQA